MLWGRQTTESEAEEKLLKELTPQLQSFYALQTREFTDIPARSTPESPELTEYKQTHSPKELRFVNCADVQASFMDCIQSGPWRERLMGCEALSQKVQNCLKLQTDLMDKLGLGDATTVDKYKEITAAADTISVKWLDEFGKQGMSPELLTEIYNKRDEIWKE